MEALTAHHLLLLSSLFIVSYFAARTFYLLWWKPKSLEKLLHQQGCRGNAYRFPYGDSMDEKQAIQKSQSRPMGRLEHRIVPRISPFVYQTVRRYGKTCVIWAGTIPRIVIGDPEMVREVLVDRSGQFRKVRSNPLTRILATGVAVLDGKEWAKRRKIVNSAFHLEKIKEMVPEFLGSCSDLVKRWDDMAGTEGCCELDAWLEFESLTGDVISRTAFGSSFEDGKRIFQLQKEQAKLAVEAAMVPYIPGFRLIPTAKNKRRWVLDKEIKSMIRTIIDRKSKSSEADVSYGSSDLLGMLLEQSRDNKNGITIEDVIEECKLFYFAGQETTLSLLTWTLILLSKHPSWQQRAREEVIRVCRSNQPDYECISQLKIVSMILYEVLRLYPPIVSLKRRTLRETKLREFTFPAGVELFLPLILIHHNPEYWGEDAEEFNPERFSNGIWNAAAAKESKNVFYPFGGGPRICLGQNFALIEAKIALSSILRNFSFELSPSYAHAPCTVITLQPLHGAHIILRRI